MILYFNTKLSSTPVFFNSGKKVTTYTSLLFPKDDLFEYPNHLDVLKSTLQSYSKLKFIACIFNIDIEETEIEFESIKELIKEQFVCKDLTFNPTRPNKIEEWRKDLEGIRKRFGDEMPIFLCQNHDHPFVDYQSFTFEHLVNTVFSEATSNFSKCLIYSHSPDFTSMCYGAKQDGVYQFRYKENEVFKTKKVDDYFDSIVILTLETALNVLDHLKFNGNYLGRFDWPGVRFKNLNLQYYFYPREFFRHFDGYYISTGMRCFDDLWNSDKIPFQFPKKKNISEKINFYYQRWIDNFIIYLRDELLKNASRSSMYYAYRNALNSSISFFDESYLKQDLKQRLINEEEYGQVKIGLKNKIHFNFNQIFSIISPEIQLYRRGILYRLKGLYINKLNKLIFFRFIKFLIPKKLILKLRKQFDKI